MGEVVAITAARRRRPAVPGLPLPSLEDVDSYIALTERELLDTKLKLERAVPGSLTEQWWERDVCALRAEIMDAHRLRVKLVLRGRLRVVRG